MTKYTVQVASPAIIGERMAKFKQVFQANREDIFTGAIVNSGLTEKIARRTPKADKARYGPVGGREQLLRSILPAGSQDRRLERLPKVTSDHILSYIIGTDKSYAPFVHEAVKPAEGEYWQKGADRGWTVRGTGNRFLAKPIEECNATIVKNLERLIEIQARKGGLI